MKNKFIPLLIISFAMGQELLNETFNHPTQLPNGWEFIPDPDQYPLNTGDWQIRNTQNNFNTNPPSATYYWSPSVSNTFDNPFEGHYMYSPIINVNVETNVIVQFQIALDGYPSPAGHYNGMNIEYSSDGNAWVTVLNYEISAGGGTVDIYPRVESFYASMETSLQIRWETYGTNSYYIDAWHVDNVKVNVIPSIQQNGRASISSNNIDSTKAIPGDIVSLSFTVPEPLAEGSPFVLINSIEAEIEVSSPLSLDYIAKYIVPEDATDGPISFSIDFTTQNGISGPTCRNTTDFTNVLVDVTGPVSPTVTDNVLPLGGNNLYTEIWNSTNENIQVEVEMPKDTTVVAFNYTIGNALDFVDNNGQVSIPSNNILNNITNEFTIEAYIKVNSAQNYQGFLDFGNYGGSQKGFGFFLYSGGWRFYLKTTGTQLNDIEHVVASAPVDTWAHFAATFNNGLLILYRDGVLVDSKDNYSGSVDWSGFSGNLILGSFDKNVTKYFDGKIDEVRIWDIARSENQIKAYKAVGLDGNEDGLIGYWRFDEGEGTESDDLTNSNNNAELQNGVNWAQDSEFLFQQDSLNTNAIIGSKFQILSKIEGNDFTPIGELAEISEEDSNADLFLITAPADSFISIPDYGHALNAEFSARLFDQAGNYEDGNTSSKTLEIDIEANDPDVVNIVSNNLFSHLAKTGDLITITMTYGEDVNVPIVTVDGNSSDVSDLGAEQFQASYTLLGTEPEGIINTIESNINDYLGNSGIYNGGSIGEGSNTVIYDRTLPTLDVVNIVSNNENTKWAKVGDQVIIKSTGSEGILNQASIIQAQTALISVLSDIEFNSSYQFSESDLEGIIEFSIAFSDSAGNDGLQVTNTSDQSWVVFDKTSPEDFSTGNVLSIGGNEVTNVWNSTNTSINIYIPIVDNDTTLINGKIKILAKIGSNGWEEIGDSFPITISDAGTNKIVSLTSLQIEAITGFADEDTITFTTILLDRPGNETQGSASINRLVIDQTIPTISLIHIESNNIDSTKAKVGDQITVSFTADEIIDNPSMIISSNNATVNNLDTYTWEGSYIMTDSDEEGSIQFQIEDYIDSRGNPADGTSLTSDESNVIFDRTKPTLDFVGLSTDNIWNNRWAKLGENASIDINASEDLLSLDLSIYENSVTEVWINPRTINHVYTFTDLDQEGIIEFEIIFSDSSGNKGDTVYSTTNDSYIVFDKTSPSDFNVGNVSSIGGNIVTSFWNSTNTGLDVIVPIDNDSTLDSGRVQLFAKTGENIFEILGGYEFILPNEVNFTKEISINRDYIEAITDYGQDEIITIRAIIYDIPGNQVTGTESSSYLTIEETLPTINYLSYSSNFSDTTLATVGHEITIIMRTNEAIQEPAALISTNVAQINDIGNNRWDCKYIMQEEDSEGPISFEISEITDLAGNPNDGTSLTTDGSVVIFDNTKPTLNSVMIKSDNLDSTWAKVGDTISVIFISDELLTEQVVTITEQNTILTDLGLEKYLATYAMTNNDLEGEIDFQITVTDSVGLISEPISETTNESAVIFDKTLPQLSYVNIQSTNENNSSIAITGDNVILTFTPLEPILLDSIFVTIANESANFVQDGDNYIATLTLSGDEPGGILPFTIDFMDRATNSGDQVITTTNNSYVNHDIVPPELLSVSIYSNNLDTSWAKPGDSVFVKFTANEALDNLNITIANSNANYLDDGGAQYRGVYELDQNDDEGNISFNIEYTDLGGAIGPSSNSSTDQTIVRYDKTLPTLSNIRMSSNNIMVDSAGIGDIDSLFFTASEPQRNVIVTILESNITPIQNDLNFIATYELTDVDLDGWVSFSILLEDSAGNSTGEITITDNNSRVWFDGTPPILNPVSFHSTNVYDSSLAIIDDTLFLDFESSESLSSISVMIAEIAADTIFVNQLRMPYRAWHILDGSETEGIIPFQIIFSDLVGNQGDVVLSTTDESNILFDITPPIEFTIDTVYISGGNVKTNYWNATNDSIVLKTPIPLDDESLLGGSLQPMVKFEDNDYNILGDEIEILNIPEVGFELLQLSRNVFQSVEGYMEDANVQFTIKIIDKAGNETIGSSNGSIIHIDETIPTLDSITISSNNILSGNWAKISDTISLLLTSSEGLDIITPIIINDTIDADVSGNGTSQIAMYIVDSLDFDGIVTFEINFSDTAGNYGILVNETTDGTTVGIDKGEPFIDFLLEGDNDLNSSYYNDSDSISLFWNHGDSISGIRETYYSLGSQENTVDIREWTLGGPDNFGGWNNLGLQNDNIYYGGVFVRDSAGNYSDTIWGNGVYIDTELPNTGIINDGQWILEMDYTPDSTFLEYTLEGFSDNIGIHHFELSIGTNNDTTNIQDWSVIDSVNNISIDGLDLDRETLYYTYIKAVDSASNKSNIISTDGIYFDDSEPRVIEITPDFNDSSKVLSVLRNDTVTIKFNRLIYFYSMGIKSSADSNFVAEESYSDSIITITWDDTLLSNDTITVYLDSALAYNTLFFSDTLMFYSHLWSDLNYDYDLTVEDILLFNQLWPETDLGPFIGSPPHVKPAPDGEANMIDLSSFAKMWQWRYFNLSLDTSNNVSRIQDNLSITGQGSNVKFTLPLQTSMAEILIGNSNLNIEKMNLIDLNSSTFLFKSVDTSNQIVQFALADDKGLDSTLTLMVPEDNSHQFSAIIQYKFLDNNGNYLLNNIADINIDLLPKEFAVYNNYPNPFNPITTVLYELPDSRNVQIRLIDLMGRTIKSINLDGVAPGRHSYIWNGTNELGNLVSTGIYFIQINAGSDTAIKKMLLLK